MNKVAVKMKHQPKHNVVNIDGVVYDADCINPGKRMIPPNVSWWPRKIGDRWHWELTIEGEIISTHD